jgi:hypothetical protein
MSNILEFPGREKQAYTYLTDQLGSLLRDDVLIAHATELLTKVYGELKDESDFSFTVNLPSGLDIDDVQRLQEDIGTGVEALRQHHHSIVIRMAAQLLLTELALFQRSRD